MFFTVQNLPLPCRPFPFDPRAHLLPEVSTRLPLSPYCNPLPALLRQPRCFPPQKPLILSLFCKDDFQEQNRRCMAITHSGTGPLSQHTHSRQATLHTAHDSAHCLAGSYQARTRRRLPIPGVLKLRRTTPGLHGSRVVCSMPLERARNP